MSLLGMQRVISRILTDKQFRTAFTDDPQGVISAYELTPKEIRSVKALDLKAASSYARLLAEGRVGLALNAFPLSRILLLPDIHRYIDEYCQENPPTPATLSPMFFESMIFYAFILKVIERGDPVSPYLRDVIEYEKNLFYIANSVEASASASRFAADNQKWGGGLSLEAVGPLKPVKGEHAQVVRFRYKVTELLPLIERQEVPTVGEDPMDLLFFKRPLHVGVKTCKINCSTRELLESCDGSRTTNTIIVDLWRTAGATTNAARDCIAAGVIRILDYLQASAVIRFDD